MCQLSIDNNTHYLSIFFLSLRRPPRSPLFPYTTLLPICRTPDICSGPTSGRAFRRARGPSPRRPPAAASSSVSSPTTDRKSTRLNSSHVEISYAVFCLKKKKTMDVGLFVVDLIRLPWHVW